MNCQDIARLIDGGSFGAINATVRQDAEAHAQQCRRCKLLWITHSRLAVSPVPAMPPDLSRQCLALVTAAGKLPASHRAPRMGIVVTSLVALAAAASMLGVSLSSKLASQHDEPLTSFAAPPVSSIPAANSDPSVAAEQTLPTATQSQVASNTQWDIPLFPPPYAAQQAFAARHEMAVQKFVELHPEVMQAPSTGTLYAGTIVLRIDGKVVDHSIRTVMPEDLHWKRSDPHSGLPNDGGEPFGNYIPKGMPLAGGRTLGADLSLRDVFVRNNFDPSRSSLRVEKIIRAQRPELMLPAIGAGGSHVTVLLSAAGAIQREVAGYMDRDAMQEQEDWSASKRAEAMAGVLGINKDQIGMMGRVGVSDSDTKRGVLVDYAWQRLPGESAPQYRQGGPGSDEGVDLAAALAVVERVMPDAFMGEQVELALGIPAILLTEKGEFVRTARVKSGNPETVFPGISFATWRLMALKNGKGATAGVYFMWQGTPGMESSGTPASTR
jgi:hypothetical protein